MISEISRIKKFYIGTIGVAIFPLLLGGVSNVRAAEFSLSAPTTSVVVSQRFEASFFLDAGDQEINAISAAVSYPTDLLRVTEIRDGNSIVNFWIDRPAVTGSGEVVFSGVIPGGYQGKQGFIFSIIFEATSTGSAAITLNDGQALINDGQGTAAIVSYRSASVDVQDAVFGTIPADQVPPIQDADPPEIFTPQVVSTSQLADGQWVLIFATQDKGSGIDHYEVQETTHRQPGSVWRIVGSPYVLQDQTLVSYIFIKALDRTGNERLAVVPPRFPQPWYDNFEIWGILILLSFILLVLIYGTTRILWQGKMRRHE